nr:O-antigen polymerase [Polaribacter sp. KT25b]
MLDIKYLSFAIIFIVLSTVFHFGEPFIYLIGKEDFISVKNIELARYSIEIYNQANFFALFIQSCVVTGFLLSSNKISCSYNEFVLYDREKKELKFLIGLGKILLILGLFSYYYYYSIQIQSILNGGVYSGIRDQNYGPEIVFKPFYHPGLFMLIIGYKKNLRIVKSLIVFGIVIELLTMLSGNRSSQILTIIVLFFIYYRIISNLSKKKVFIFAAILFVFSNVLYLISSIRNYGIVKESENISISTLLNIDGFISLLAQLGSNLNVVILSIRDVPLYTSFNYGWTYIVSLVSFVPNVGGILGEMPNQYAFLNYLNTDYPLGGSYIAELFFNFGWFSFPFAILIGFVLGKFNNLIEYTIINRLWISFSLYISVLSSLLWWIRDYFSSWILVYVWISIAIYSYKKLKVINKNI